MDLEETECEDTYWTAMVGSREHGVKFVSQANNYHLQYIHGGPR